MKDLSIIIVNYNSGDLLEKCVRSIENSLDISYEVIVVDNDSKDNSTDFLKDSSNNIRLVKKYENSGFSIANNIGVEYSTGRYIHFLNPDTTINSSLNKEYRNLISTNERCVYVTKIIDHDHSEVKSWELIPEIVNYIRSIIKIKSSKYWYLGASVIMSRDIFDEIGKWSEEYFMYGEDLDLFYKIHNKGILVKMLDAGVYHIGGGTTVKVWSKRERAKKVQASNLKFAKKNNLLVDFFVIRLLVILKKLFTSPKEAYFMMGILCSVIYSSKERNRL